MSHRQPTLPEAGEMSASVLKGGLGGTPVSTAARQASRTTESVLRKAISLRVFYCLFRGLGKKEFRGGDPIRNRSFALPRRLSSGLARPQSAFSLRASGCQHSWRASPLSSYLAALFSLVTFLLSGEDQTQQSIKETWRIPRNHIS